MIKQKTIATNRQLTICDLCQSPISDEEQRDGTYRYKGKPIHYRCIARWS